MKNVARILIAFVAVMFTASCVAQSAKPGLTIGASLYYSNPKGSFKEVYKGGLGAEVKGGVGIGKTYIVASAAYAAYAPQHSNSGTLTYAPIKVGVKQYLLAKRFFVNGDVGVATIKSKQVNVKNRLCADVGAGVRLLGFEAGLYYETWKNAPEAAQSFSGNVSFRIGYNITL